MPDSTVLAERAMIMLAAMSMFWSLVGAALYLGLCRGVPALRCRCRRRAPRRIPGPGLVRRTRSDPTLRTSGTSPWDIRLQPRPITIGDPEVLRSPKVWDQIDKNHKSHVGRTVNTTPIIICWLEEIGGYYEGGIALYIHAASQSHPVFLQDNMAHMTMAYFHSTVRTPQPNEQYLRLELNMLAGALTGLLPVVLPNGGRTCRLGPTPLDWPCSIAFTLDETWKEAIDRIRDYAVTTLESDRFGMVIWRPDHDHFSWR